MELNTRNFIYGGGGTGTANTVDFMAGLRLKDTTGSTIRRCTFEGCKEECRNEEEYMSHTSVCTFGEHLKKSTVGVYLRIRWEEGATRGWEGDEFGDQKLGTDVLTGPKYKELYELATEWSKAAGRNSNGLVVHRVELDDTLQGIAIKYGTTTAALQVCNKMGFGGNLHAMQTIVIPDSTNAIDQQNTNADPAPEQVSALARGSLLKRFCREVGCSTDEGLIVLSIANYNLKAAREEAKAMADFEAKKEGSTGKGGGVA